MAERMKATIPVFLFLINDHDEVYLQRRFQTGYMDGLWETISGKTDEGEFPPMAASREALEEAGVITEPELLELFHTYANLSGGQPWIGFMFRSRQWKGIPSIQEPNKCDAAGFFPIDALPDNLTPQVRDAIGRLLVGPAIEMSLYSDIS